MITLDDGPQSWILFTADDMGNLQYVNLALWLTEDKSYAKVFTSRRDLDEAIKLVNEHLAYNGSKLTVKVQEVE